VLEGEVTQQNGGLCFYPVIIFIVLVV